MDKADVEDWLDLYGRAWIDGDPDQIVRLFTQDAIYQETPFAEPMIGQAAIRQYWQDGAADAQKDVTFASQVWAIDGTIAVAGWQASFTRTTTGSQVCLNGAFRLAFRPHTGALSCARLEEWWHKEES